MDAALVLSLPAGGDVHHLLVAQLSAEHLGVSHRPVHGHELHPYIAVVTAKGQDTDLKLDTLADFKGDDDMEPQQGSSS